MKDFVDKMWEFAHKGMAGDQTLSEQDMKIFHEAIKVKNELNRYHGRANFNDWNLEDILSILSFNRLGGRQSDRKGFKKIIRAIARTIELTCTVKHDGKFTRIQEEGPSVYRDFWKNLFEWSSISREIPTIITFNYDLVLERSLFQILYNKIFDSNNRPFPYHEIAIKYHYGKLEEQLFLVKGTHFSKKATLETYQGTTVEPVKETANIGRSAALEILKLHGSLNFPNPKTSNEPFSYVNAVDDPYILPPVFNKLSTNNINEIWRVALQRLRSAKRIVIVGYSLPRTDIYMQYFLKSALGPNVDLNRISVFDPVLFKRDQETEETEEMENRFSDCFSAQIRNRIVFRPSDGSVAGEKSGTFTHFVETISQKPEEIFF